MLRWRVLTAAVLAPAVLLAIWYWPPHLLAALFAVIVVLAGWEWTQLMKAPAPLQALLASAFAAVVVFGWWVLATPGGALAALTLAAAWWILASAWTVRVGLGAPLRIEGTAVWIAVGLLVLWPAWLGLVYLHGHLPDGPVWVVFLLLLVWGADTGAYFAGRAWGRHRLAPRISPGKTWEGVIGGAVAALVVGLGFVAWMDPVRPAWPILALLAAVVIAVSVLGDLFESLLKRQQGVKDSGALLPGHGGLLDRVDSLTAAAPVMAAGLAWWQTTL